MTERRRSNLQRSANHLKIGPSQMHWDGQKLSVRVQEISTPFFKPLIGEVTLEPKGFNTHAFPLAQKGQHYWRPIAPVAHVEANFHQPDLHWQGDGYFDMNWGSGPLEEAFVSWNWSRASLSHGTSVLYDAQPLEDERLAMALRFDSSGSFEQFPYPRSAALPRSSWHIQRGTASDDGTASLLTSFEDTPFYTRSLIASSLCGEPVVGVHESLSLKRFAHPLVKCMLPFRMPRR